MRPRRGTGPHPGAHDGAHGAARSRRWRIAFPPAPLPLTEAGRYVRNVRDCLVDVCNRPYRAVVAEAFGERLLGLHLFAEDPAALVVPGSSVHGFGLRGPVWVVGVDEQGRGTGGRVLMPRRLVRFPGASAVVEVPAGPSCFGEHRSHLVQWHR